MEMIRYSCLGHIELVQLSAEYEAKREQTRISSTFSTARRADPGKKK
jgi:hypothetical protein